MKNAEDTMLCESDLYPLRRLVDQIKFSQTPKEDLEKLIAKNVHEDRTYFPMTAPFNCFAPREGKNGLQTVTRAHIPKGYHGHKTSIIRRYDHIEILSKTTQLSRAPKTAYVKNNRSIQSHFNNIIGNIAKTEDFQTLISTVSKELGYDFLNKEREIQIR